MSLLLSEIKIIMEFCEGRSFGSVGKCIEELGGRVGEGVAGRLAKGVSTRHEMSKYVCIWTHILDLLVYRYLKDLRTCIPKKLSTATSNLPTYFYPTKESSNFVTSVFPESSWGLVQIPSPEPALHDCKFICRTKLYVGVPHLL